MNLTPRHYQRLIFDDIRQAYRERFRAPLLVSPTGSGKTFIFAWITEQAALKGSRILILTHRRELIMQTSEALDGLGVPHGIIAPGYPLTVDHVQVASVQTVVRRLDRIAAPDMIIIDECFPAGTLVDGKPIEEIKIGDTVSTFDHTENRPAESSVLHIFKSRPHSLCRIIFNTGKTLICTPNHPIYSVKNACYIPAISLYKDSMVLSTIERREYGNTQTGTPNLQNMRDSFYSNVFKKHMLSRMFGQSEKSKEIASGYNEMHGMRKRCCLRRKDGKIKNKKRSGVLFRGMQRLVCVKTSQCKNDANKSEICIRKNAPSESNEKTRSARKGFYKITSNAMEAYRALRKRNFVGTPKIACLRPRMGNGGPCFDVYGQRFGISILLQNRHRKQNFENRDRSGRKLALRVVQKKTGREENRIFGIARVESIEILQSGSDGKFGGLCPDGFVYNLEVEGNHNYFANGILVHNCHHSVAGSWSKILCSFSRARLLGVTATPVRLDGKGLGIKSGGFFDKLIYGPTVKELTKLGFLSPSIVYAPPIGADLEGLRHKYGDFQMAEAAERLDKPTITGCAVTHYQRICPGVPAIAFCSSVEHAEHVAEQFNDAGIPAESIDGTLNDSQRRYRIQALGDGRIKVLTSCDIISEGTDIPVVTAAILLRPTESMGLCLQQIGRCLRPFPGKTQSIILDHVGNCLKHGLPDDDRQWSLDGEVKKPRGEREINPYVQCAKCYAVYSRTLERCPQCGTGREVDPREIEQVEGNLELITPESIRLDYLKREEAKRNRKQLMEKAETLDDLKKLAKTLGYHWKWAVHIYNARQERKTA